MRKFWGILHLPPEHLHILQASASVHTLHSICVYTVVLFLTFHIPFYRLSWHKVKCMKKYSFPNDQSIKLIFCDFWFVFSFSARMISLIIIINNRSKCPIHLKSQTEKKFYMWMRWNQNHFKLIGIIHICIYLRIFRFRWWHILKCIIVILLLAFFSLSRSCEMYENEPISCWYCLYTLD